MKNTLTLSLIILTFAAFVSAQEISREQKFQRILELDTKVKNSINEYLSPDAEDINAASKIGAEVFRIIPRGKIDFQTGIRGGGAYYSFSTKSHDYNSQPQIELQQDNLSVGFAGADYGFIKDLGEIPLASINTESYAVNFLANYRPPTKIVEIRSEQHKSLNYDTGGITYKHNLPATVGNSYVLRAISFEDADVLVAFKIHRKDTDGSLIIFWKMLKEFEKPIIDKTAGK